MGIARNQDGVARSELLVHGRGKVCVSSVRQDLDGGRGMLFKDAHVVLRLRYAIPSCQPELQEQVILWHTNAKVARAATFDVTTSEPLVRTKAVTTVGAEPSRSV